MTTRVDDVMSGRCAARLVRDCGDSLLWTLRSVGRSLKRFHTKYANQHGDLHTHNIIVDDNHDITFIDLQTMVNPLNGLHDMIYLKQKLAKP